jgi:hypothetical protein
LPVVLSGDDADSLHALVLAAGLLVLVGSASLVAGWRRG